MIHYIYLYFLYYRYLCSTFWRGISCRFQENYVRRTIIMFVLLEKPQLGHTYVRLERLHGSFIWIKRVGLLGIRERNLEEIRKIFPQILTISLRKLRHLSLLFPKYLAYSIVAFSWLRKGNCFLKMRCQNKIRVSDAGLERFKSWVCSVFLYCICY